MYLNDEWDRFAAANTGERAAAARVLARPLWDFIADATTQTLYQQALKLIRDGRVLRFSFRCDAPDRRRLFEMTVAPGPDGTIEFRTRTVSDEGRPAVPLLDPAAPRTDEAVRVCGWCNKVFAAGAWVELEEAVERLRLFECAAVPALTHGVCEPCYEQMTATVSDP